MTERRQRGYVTPPPASIADINNLSFQAKQRIVLGGLTNVSMFRNTPEADYQIQSFGRHEKVSTGIKRAEEKEKRGSVSYLFVPESRDVVTHTWPSGTTYDADLSIWIMEANASAVEVKKQVLCRAAQIKAQVSGSLGLMTSRFDRFVIWCESIRKFVLLIWANFDSIDWVSVAHVEMDGRITKHNRLFSIPWLNDSSTYALMNSAAIRADGSVSDYPYVLCFQTGGSFVERKVVSFNQSTLEVRNSVSCTDVPVLMDNAGKVYQVPPFDVGGTATYTYRPACFVANGILLGAGYASAEHGLVFHYPDKDNLSTRSILYRRTVYSPPSWVPLISYLRTKDLVCLMGDNMYGGTVVPTLVMDMTGKINYYFSSGTPGAVMWTSGVEMLRRT